MKDKIEFGEDFVRISDEEGEIVYWHMDEWIENPQVVFSILNAVRLLGEGKDLRILIQ